MEKRTYEIFVDAMGEFIEMNKNIDLPEAIIYTDGACLGNPGPGGWAAIIKEKSGYREIWGGEKNTTNNRMELLAVIKALQALKRPYKVTLVTDSKYIYNAINQGWLERWKNNGWVTATKTPVKNKDLWQKVLKLLEKHGIDIKWIPGHRGNLENEKCDKLARKAAQYYK